jgi:serine/threonine protein kinase
MVRERKNIQNFELREGRIIARKYEVIGKLGAGWEGEVYKVKERRTGIERAAKLFFPQRNIRDKTSNFNARKLHKLRKCSIVIHYHTEETITYRRTPITVLISEFVEGELLSRFLLKFPGKRLTPYQGLHLLYALVKGIEEIHRLNEYHGDLHTDNIIVNRFGLGFNLKLVDLFQWTTPKKENRQDDICDLIRVYYDSIGGAKHYAKHPPSVKKICCGLKRGLILKKFPTVTRLREYLETMRWETGKK